MIALYNLWQLSIGLQQLVALTGEYLPTLCSFHPIFTIARTTVLQCVCMPRLLSVKALFPFVSRIFTAFCVLLVHFLHLLDCHKTTVPDDCYGHLRSFWENSVVGYCFHDKLHQLHRSRHHAQCMVGALFNFK